MQNTDAMIKKSYENSLYSAFGVDDGFADTLASGCNGDLACEAALSSAAGQQ